MTDEQKLQHLRGVRDNLKQTLEAVNIMIDDITVIRCKLEHVRGNTVSLPDSFSEDKEKFLAP